MSVDVSKIKVGDEVMVRCVVNDIGALGSIGLSTVDENPDEFRAMPGAILSHTPKGFAVGDRVKVRGDEAEGEIKAVWADSAWVLFTTDNENEPVTLPNSNLERL